MQARLVSPGDVTSLTLEQEQPNSARIAIKRGSAVTSLISVGGKTYVKANAAQTEQEHHPGVAAGLLASHWLEVEGKEADASKGLEVQSLARCLAHETGSLVVGGTTVVSGRETVTVTDKGDVPGSTPSKFYIAAAGEPFLLRVVSTGHERAGGKPDAQCSEGKDTKEAGGEITFRYNEPLNIQAPAGALTQKQLTELARP
jgi:hypothetical protein